MIKTLLQLTIASAILLFAANAFAEVHLIQADAYTNYHYGIKAVTRTATVKVKDLAYEKDLKFFLEYEDGTWAEFGNARFVEDIDSEWELWTISAVWTNYNYYTEPTPNFGDEFVIKYEVAGNTYWDNNYGNNFIMGHNDGEYLADGINVSKLSINAYKLDYPGSSGVVNFWGTILVKNLAYNKSVCIVYTTDNWASTQEVYATYSYNRFIPYGGSITYPNVHGVERWSFEQELDANVTDIEYVIRYEVDNNTYWDNNYGKNYKINGIN
jgi:hypothetical protein